MTIPSRRRGTTLATRLNSGARAYQPPIARAKSGDNERKFKDHFEANVSGTPLKGKQRFNLPGIEISVDQSFEHEGKDFLVEIDSANMAKLIVGQYVLINLLRNLPKEAFFLVVHAYKDYKPMRTVKNLQLVNERIYKGKGIPFGAVHITKLTKWSGGVPGLLAMLHTPEASNERNPAGKAGAAPHL